MGSALHRLWLARTKQTSCKSMFFAARAPPNSRCETGGGSSELRPPISDSVPLMSVHIVGGQFVFCVFPFAGTGWPSIGGGKDEAQLLEIEGAACQVREATA